mmetsp:Transcript_53609/g.143657  ORF Transcript_53609/g.143657 Transcript_53609/m.143657 type:complete len:271 (-) Transcript_53609:610-1422(-)
MWGRSKAELHVLSQHRHGLLPHPRRGVAQCRSRRHVQHVDQLQVRHHGSFGPGLRTLWCHRRSLRALRRCRPGPVHQCAEEFPGLGLVAPHFRCLPRGHGVDTWSLAEGPGRALCAHSFHGGRLWLCPLLPPAHGGWHLACVGPPLHRAMCLRHPRGPVRRQLGAGMHPTLLAALRVPGASREAERAAALWRLRGVHGLERRRHPEPRALERGHAPRRPRGERHLRTTPRRRCGRPRALMAKFQFGGQEYHLLVRRCLCQQASPGRCHHL